MVTEPIRVYLDSSDFSRLSNPRRSTVEQEIAAQLREWADAGLVQFLFSGIHLVEMAPLDTNSTLAATERVDLLVGLCGRNALVSIDRIVAAELHRLHDPYAASPIVVSNKGEWYPAWGNLVSPVQWADTIREVDLTSKGHGLNRQQRRLAKRKIFKHGRPTAVTRAFLLENEKSSDYKELLEQYPMRPHDARVLGKYILGEATAEEANEAFLEGLRDPRWMMRWFANHQSKTTPFTDWLRAPALKLLRTVEEMAKLAERLRLLEAVLGNKRKPDILSANQWARQQDEVVCRLAQRMLAHEFSEGRASVTAQDVDARCPGLSTSVRLVHSAMRDSTSEIPRRPKRSDFADGVHAMYAPYVDYFRADAYMAAHVQRALAQHSTTVVSNLRNLVPEIGARLVAQAGRDR